MKKLISRCNFLKMGALASAVMMLAACGGGAGGGKDSGANVDVTGAVSFPLAEQVTFTGMTSYPVGSESDPNNRTIFKRLEEATNVHIDWTAIQADQWSDKITLNMSNPSTLTDFVFTADFSDSDLLRYADQGVIVNLEDYIDNNMPNLKKVFEMYPEYRTMCTDSEGHIWALPWIEQLGAEKTAIQTVGNMSFINKKWLDFLGLEMPTTVDEFEQVLIAFRDNADAIKSEFGIEGDIIPMSCIVNNGDQDPSILINGFGEGYGDADKDRHIAVTDDLKVICAATQQGYREGLDWLHKLYSENLIDPECFTQEWSTYAYTFLFSKGSIIGTAYKNTIIATVVGTILCVISVGLYAYPISRKDFRWRNVFTFISFFTMLFNAGLVPFYLLVRDVGLLDTRWSLILPFAVSTYNTIIMRNFFQGVPNALYEAASIDGCSYFKYFLRILLPISLPSIATICLFYAVSYWNAFFSSILFITDRTKYPIQAILRQILMSSEFNTLLYDDAAQSMPSEMLKCAMIVITALPIICVYPFLQRYFVKGVMVGSLKG